MTVMPRATSCVETVDFPVAIPPVKPITVLLLEPIARENREEERA